VKELESVETTSFGFEGICREKVRVDRRSKFEVDCKSNNSFLHDVAPSQDFSEQVPISGF